jgi:hypothetical protein
MGAWTPSIRVTDRTLFCMVTVTYSIGSRVQSSGFRVRDSSFRGGVGQP